ncbi:MAG: NADH:flavin oxidoreductase [Paraclostridium sp.]|uniref:NADH:flavin oxidoreductase n=1 Tax=Paraclostridium sp. TaxID=2023273 RepID=UPI003F40AF94
MIKTLFDKTKIKNLQLKNRFVRSATWEGLANENSHMNDEIFKVYTDLAKGGVGLIITSYAHICADEQPTRNMLGIYDDSFIGNYKNLTETIHSYNSKIIMQIVYGGSQTSYNTENRLILGPSSIANIKTGVTPKSMDKNDIDSIVNSFAEAAYRCKLSGFDGVQIHGAHGYLLSQFLDPYHNRRTDEYGGCIENRARIIFEVYNAIRKKVGDTYHISIKINSSDFREDGATFSDCMYVVKKLDMLGVDSVEVSGGNFRNFKGESYFKDYASKISSSVNCPIMLVGGNRTVDSMSCILNSTNIEYFSICRPLICEPNLINEFKSNSNYKHKCVNCNQCMKKDKLCILHV